MTLAPALSRLRRAGSRLLCAVVRMIRPGPAGATAAQLPQVVALLRRAFGYRGEKRYGCPLTACELAWLSRFERLRDRLSWDRPQRILIRRQQAWGDVLLATSVLPPLRRRHPGAILYFQTARPEVLEGNPFVDFVLDRLPETIRFDRVIDLDLAYERSPTRSVVDCYAEAAGVEPGECQPFIRQAAIADEALGSYVVFHTTAWPNWVGRSWKVERWQEVIDWLRGQGLRVVSLGEVERMGLACDHHYGRSLGLPEMAGLIGRARLFIGGDSMPMHIAQTLGTPGVAFFGSVRPELRLIGTSITPVTAAGLECLGCLHRQPPPVDELPVCETGELACESQVTVEQFLDAIRARLGSSPAVSAPHLIAQDT